MNPEANSIASGMRDEYTTVDSPLNRVILEQVAFLCGGSYAELSTGTAQEAENAARLASGSERIGGDMQEFMRWVAMCPPLTPEERCKNISEGLQAASLRIARLTVPAHISREALDGVACDISRISDQEFGGDRRRSFLEARGILEKETY